jgi:hypothetical protein
MKIGLFVQGVFVHIPMGNNSGWAVSCFLKIEWWVLGRHDYIWLIGRYGHGKSSLLLSFGVF